VSSLDLSTVQAADLRRELARRDGKEAREREEALNERYGPCPECGATLRRVGTHVVEEILSAPGWRGWPVPPPPEHVRRDGATWETTITCENGHERHEQETRFTRETTN